MIKRFLKRLCLFLFIFLPLKMAYDIHTLPTPDLLNFNNGKAYVYYSSDKQSSYKLLEIYSSEPSKNDWRPVFVIIDKKTRSIVSITQLPDNWDWDYGVYWQWSDTKPSKLTAFSFNNDDGGFPGIFSSDINLAFHSLFFDVSLPPSLWRRAHAWLAVKLLDINLDNLILVYDDPSEADRW